jgi:hypothetical protein
MSGGPAVAFKNAVGAEARFFFGQVQAGRITTADAREAIDLPDAVRSIWRTAAADDVVLCALFVEAMRFRAAVGEHFEKLLENASAAALSGALDSQASASGPSLSVCPELTACATLPIPQAMS